jgi:phosphate transport system substrate-binding protein
MTTSIAHVLRYTTLLVASFTLGLPVQAQAQAPVHSPALVRISGTGSGTGGMQLLAKAFMDTHPDSKVEVLAAIGSSGGISALLSGQIEVAVSNRKPKEAELSRQALSSVEYARTPFVVAVSRDLGITALTSTQLAGLFAEGVVNFPNGKRARPVLRLSDATDTDLLKSFSPEVAKALDAASQRRGMLNADTDADAADMLERTAGAFGASTLALITSEKRRLVALAIDNKVPSVENLISGAYPYHKPLFLISGAEASPHAKRFVAFAQSPAGQALLRANGHAPR